MTTLTEPASPFEPNEEDLVAARKDLAFQLRPDPNFVLGYVEGRLRRTITGCRAGTAVIGLRTTR